MLDFFLRLCYNKKHNRWEISVILPIGKERGIVIKTTLMTVAAKVGDRLSVLPVSKSTHVLYLSGGEFDRFSAATGVTYDSLATWDGFFSAAEEYYRYSGGKPFCAFDYFLRAVELCAVSEGADPASFYRDDWYDFSDGTLKACYLRFAEAIAKGHIVIADLYSNTQVMTGETPAGMGSSAGILYYNDTVTYPDNTSAAMQEVDPDGYAHFCANLCRLTPKEREIFDLYLAGKNGKEIRDSLGITENTLKYHNKNIYQTLNIASRKELLRYAALMEGNKKESGTSSARQ